MQLIFIHGLPATGKLTVARERLHTAGTFDASYMPKPRLSIDTSLSTPVQAAEQINLLLKKMTGV